MALEQPKHGRGIEPRRGKKHRQLSPHFRDCVCADHALHRDGKTSQVEGRDKRPDTAIPNDLLSEAVGGILLPWFSPFVTIWEEATTDS